MNNIVFDGDRIRKVRFKSSFLDRLSKESSGSVIFIEGPENDAVSAVCTLMVGLKPVSARFHDAKDIALGVLSWHTRDCCHNDSFRFSMEMLQLVGFGYADAMFVDKVHADKNGRFQLWLQQALKHRVASGRATIIASPTLKDGGAFFGKNLITQCGIIERTQNILEVRSGKKKKRSRFESA